MERLRAIIVIALTLLSARALAFEGPPSASLVNDPSNPGPPVRIIGESFPVRIESVLTRHGHEVSFWVELSGRVTEPFAELWLGETRLERAFRTKVALKGRLTPVRFRMVRLDGSEIAVLYGLSFREHPRWMAREYARPFISPEWSGSASLGFTAGRYVETGLKDLRQTGITANVSLSWRPRSTSWEFGATGYVTVAAISFNRDRGLRFLGLNLRAGLPVIRSARWQLTMMGGVYYTTTLVSDGAFGFRNMMGPQLYPALTHRFDPQRSVSAYFKYSPIFAGLSPSLESREIAGGLSYRFPAFGPRRAAIVTADYADLLLKFPRFDATARSQSSTLSLGWEF